MNADRRDFLRTAGMGAVALGAASVMNSAHAAGSDVIKVGLIGCGGRGSDAAMNNVLQSAPNVKIVALGDVFREPIFGNVEAKRVGLRDALIRKFPDKVDLPEDRCHVGLNAFE